MARRKKSDDSWVLWALGLLAGLAAVSAFLRWANEHLAWVLSGVTLMAVVALAVGFTCLALRRKAAAARWARQEAMTRSIEITDGMEGRQFERWLAVLMTSTGYVQVQVCGGAGDLGADLRALTPDNRLVVVQAKRHGPANKVGSPDVQRFAGTCWQRHNADIALLVTTSAFTRPATELAASVGITLVDRTALAAWATDRVAPVALGRTSAR